MFLDSLGIGKSILFKVYKCFVIYGKLLWLRGLRLIYVGPVIIVKRKFGECT
jgi:hypothetical protein